MLSLAHQTLVHLVAHTFVDQLRFGCSASASRPGCSASGSLLSASGSRLYLSHLQNIVSKSRLGHVIGHAVVDDLPGSLFVCAALGSRLGNAFSAYGSRLLG